jgi:hypothetical protein
MWSRAKPRQRSKEGNPAPTLAGRDGKGTLAYEGTKELLIHVYLPHTYTVSRVSVSSGPSCHGQCCHQTGLPSAASTTTQSGWLGYTAPAR